jgi:hypothetical protein
VSPVLGVIRSDERRDGDDEGSNPQTQALVGAVSADRLGGRLEGKAEGKNCICGSFGFDRCQKNHRIICKPKDQCLLGRQRHDNRRKTEFERAPHPRSSVVASIHTTPVQVAQTPEYPFRGSMRLPIYMQLLRL